MPSDSGMRSFLRDFFFELARDSDNLRADFQFDRELWFRGLDLHRKEEILFELEMYLRAIGCFFNLHNQLLDPRDGAITRDFSEELRVLAAALERAAALAQLLLDRGLASSMNFQSYIETQIAPDYLRLQMLRRTLDQRRPEESLYLVNRTFRDLKKLLDHLLKRPPCTYPLFYHLGQVVTREIAFNRFFNPLLILEFRPEYDRIRSVIILDVIRALPATADRRALSKIFLALFRLLHYLRYVPRLGQARIVRRSLILFTLFHSEASTLAGFLRVLAERPQALSSELGAVADQAAGRLRGELSRIFGTELVRVDVKRSKLVGDEERSIESGRELLERFLKRLITDFVQVYQPEVTEDVLFDSSRNQSEQSQRLRADLWLYRQLLERAIDSLQAEPGEARPKGWLERFADYFHETSYNFLRYGDGGPFERFATILTESLRPEGEPGSLFGPRFLEDCRRFRDYLSETYDQVCRRAELASTPLEPAALGAPLASWLQGGEA